MILNTLGLDPSLTHGALVAVQSVWNESYQPDHPPTAAIIGLEVLMLWDRKHPPILTEKSSLQEVMSFGREIGLRISDDGYACGVDYDKNSAYFAGRAGAAALVGFVIGVAAGVVLADETSGASVHTYRPIEVRAWLGLGARAKKAEVWEHLLKRVGVSLVIDELERVNEDCRDAIVLAMLTADEEYSRITGENQQKG
jgi:hypothetical protein